VGDEAGIVGISSRRLLLKEETKSSFNRMAGFSCESQTLKADPGFGILSGSDM
jgi:hypothetical protein